MSPLSSHGSTSRLRANAWRRSLIAAALLLSGCAEATARFTGPGAPPTRRRPLAWYKPIIPDGAGDIGRIEVLCNPAWRNFIWDPLRSCEWDLVVKRAAEEAAKFGGDGIYDIEPPRPRVDRGESDSNTGRITARVFRFFSAAEQRPVSLPPPKPAPNPKPEANDSDF